MSDYKELIEKLEHYLHLGDAPIGRGWGALIDKQALKDAADALEQLVEERDIHEAILQGLREADDEIIKGLQTDLARAATIRDYLGRKYGDCFSCCVPNCNKRDNSNNAPCGNWESVEVIE